MFCETGSKDSDELITDLGDASLIKDIKPIYSRVQTRDKKTQSEHSLISAPGTHFVFRSTSGTNDMTEQLKSPTVFAHTELTNTSLADA